MPADYQFQICRKPVRNLSERVHHIGLAFEIGDQLFFGRDMLQNGPPFVLLLVVSRSLLPRC